MAVGVWTNAIVRGVVGHLLIGGVVSIGDVVSIGGVILIRFQKINDLINGKDAIVFSLLNSSLRSFRIGFSILISSALVFPSFFRFFTFLTFPTIRPIG
jgi:hypothetical protein